MSRSRAWFILPLLLGALACATRPPQPVVDPRNASGDIVRAKAEEYFTRGEAQLQGGDLKSARFCFDQALDTVLNSPLDHPHRTELLNDFTERISTLELNLLRDRFSHESEQQEDFLDEVIATPLFSPSEQEVKELEQKIATAGPVSYSLPVLVNSQVVSFMRAFQNLRHERIQESLDRAQEYLEPFKEIFRRHQLPEDLVYLPLIESGFRCGSVSRAGAKGMWQFMASTARMFGLEVSSTVDERLDPFKAADAAARFLKAMYEKYRDWYIVLASYNGGPGRLERAMNRLQTRDFFEINQTRYIRQETKTYVPAFLAGLIIAKSPADYGFIVGTPTPRFADTQRVSIPSPLNLSAIAAAVGVPLGRLKELNPELLRDFTPPGKPFYDLRLPTGVDVTPVLSMQRIKPPKLPSGRTYRVRRGDTLGAIARRFRVSLSALKRANPVHTKRLRIGARLVIPGGR